MALQRAELGEAELAQLLQSVASGNQSALTSLLGIYGRAIAAFASRFLAGDLGEDIVQEVFLKVWREAHRFDPGRGSASAWIWRIARNTCIDHARSRKIRRFFGLQGSDARRRDENGEDEVLGHPDEAPGSEAQLGAKEELALVRRQIETLPEAQRMALLLIAVSGMDTGEVAGIMGKSVGAVEQLLVRARRSLRQSLTIGGGEDGGT